MAFAVKFCCIIKVYDNGGFCFCGYNRTDLKCELSSEKNFHFVRTTNFAGLFHVQCPVAAKEKQLCILLFVRTCTEQRAISVTLCIWGAYFSEEKHHSLHFTAKFPNIFPLCSLRQSLEKKAPNCVIHSGHAISAVGQLSQARWQMTSKCRLQTSLTLIQGAFSSHQIKLWTQKGPGWGRVGEIIWDFQFLFQSLWKYPLK